MLRDYKILTGQRNLEDCVKQCLHEHSLLVGRVADPHPGDLVGSESVLQ